MSSKKVLVLNATGKVGRNTCRALKEADAFSAEDWFRFHSHYSNGEKIGS
jgi:uncharacterized protein YbjT (DUF2867 family)